MIDIGGLTSQLKSASEPILSLYLLVDPGLGENQSRVPAWSRWLRTALKDIEKNLDETSSDLWPVICAEVETFVESYKPQGKTLVLFVGRDLRVIHELPVPLKNLIAFGQPALTLLLDTLNHNKPYLIALVGHDSARFWMVTLDGITQYETMSLDMHRDDWTQMTLMPATSAGGNLHSGSHRDRFTDRVNEHIERFYREVADHTMNLGRIHQVEYIVLGGDLEVAHALHGMIAGPRVLGPVRIAMHTTPAAICQQAAAVVSEHQLAQDENLVEELINMAEPGGRGAVGSQAFAAVEQQRVELLVVPWPTVNEHLVDYLTYRALVSGAEVQSVGGAAAERLIEVGGMAARLYYEVSA